MDLLALPPDVSAASVDSSSSSPTLQCRACSELGADYELVALFAGAGQLARIYATCTGLSPCRSDDGLPGHLCAGCNAKLVAFNKFRQRCVQWDTTFRAQLPAPAKQEEQHQHESKEKSIATAVVKTEAVRVAPPSTALIAIDVVADHEYVFNTAVDANPPADNDEPTEYEIDEMPAATDEQEPDVDEQQPSNTYPDDDVDMDNNFNSDEEADELVQQDYDAAGEVYEEIVIEDDGGETDGASQTQFLDAGDDEPSNDTTSSAGDDRPKPHACSVDGCDRQYGSRNSLLAHIRREHDEIAEAKSRDHPKTHVCCHDDCGRAYGSRIALLAHYRRIHEQNDEVPADELPKIVCWHADCDRHYGSKAALLLHYRRIHGPIEENDPAAVYHTDPLRRVRKDTPEEGTMKAAAAAGPVTETKEAPAAGESAAETSTSTTTTTTTPTKRPVGRPRAPFRRFVCEECGKQFTSKTSLKKHAYVHGDAADLPYACTVCDKRLVTRHKLKEHMMRHEGVKNFICPHCGLRKTTMNELKVHINYHTKEKVWPCGQCSLTFSNVGNMTRHVRIVHEGLRAFPCAHCHRSFGKAETLKHHEMTHTGERPHGCAECGRRFIQLVALQTHQRTHLKRGSRGAGGAVTKGDVVEEEEVVEFGGEAVQVLDMEQVVEFGTEAAYN